MFPKRTKTDSSAGGTPSVPPKSCFPSQYYLCFTEEEQQSTKQQHAESGIGRSWVSCFPLLYLICKTLFSYPDYFKNIFLETHTRYMTSLPCCCTSMPHICSPSLLSIGGRFVSPSAILCSELKGKRRRKTKIITVLDTTVSALVRWLSLTVSGGSVEIILA